METFEELNEVKQKYPDFLSFASCGCCYIVQTTSAYYVNERQFHSRCRVNEKDENIGNGCQKAHDKGNATCQTGNCIFKCESGNAKIQYTDEQKRLYMNGMHIDMIFVPSSIPFSIVSIFVAFFVVFMISVSFGKKKGVWSFFQ